MRHSGYKDLGFAKVDVHRHMRKGFPEVIYGAGKTREEIVKIAKRIVAHNGILLITRSDKKTYGFIKDLYPGAKFYPRAGVISYTTKSIRPKRGKILVVTAGTSDISVAEEAIATLEAMGEKAEALYDVGVAGMHRLIDKRKTLERASVIIVIAGMEGALASVVSGLVSKPVIAVPTSVGYGASFKGIAPLLTMLNSCSPGIAVVNIDNGFGAGYFASLINP
ncbi:MAG: nickel pincer cofactor biosynthesis protein LarB [Candidatus Omnitrophota bacterium]